MGGEEILGLPGTVGPRGPRWGLIAGIAVGLIVLAIVAFWVFGRAKPAAKPASQLPLVSVVVPGRSTVARTVSATGSLAARREMPVGVSR